MRDAESEVAKGERANIKKTKMQKVKGKKEKGLGPCYTHSTSKSLIGKGKPPTLTERERERERMKKHSRCDLD